MCVCLVRRAFISATGVKDIVSSVFFSPLFHSLCHSISFSSSVLRFGANSFGRAQFLFASGFFFLYFHFHSSPFVRIFFIHFFLISPFVILTCSHCSVLYGCVCALVVFGFLWSALRNNVQGKKSYVCIYTIYKNITQKLSHAHNIYKMLYRTFVSLALSPLACCYCRCRCRLFVCSCKCLLLWKRPPISKAFSLNHHHQRRCRRRRTSSSYHTLLIIVCDCACFSLHFISSYGFFFRFESLGECKQQQQQWRQQQQRAPLLCVLYRSETTFFPRLKLMTFFPTPVLIHTHTHTLLYVYT